MKIYTKKGDSGETSLFGGGRVKKNALRIEAYGTVDELNSVVGWVLTQSPSSGTRETLRDIQHQLFKLGSDLATPLDAKANVGRIGEEEIGRLESIIDLLDKNLPELKNFILPGGSPCGAGLHLARTVCRRAERAAVACGREEELNRDVIVYLNRLSDLFFVLARHENRKTGSPETKWKPDR